MSRDPVSGHGATNPRQWALRHWGLRLAFAVTLGLTFETLRGASLPFLAPVLALQLLAVLQRPPPAKLVVMLVAVSAATSGVAYFVSIMTVEHAELYAIGVGLLYLWGFVLALTPKTASIGVLTITMTVVITGLASSSTGVALSILVSLVISVAASFVLVYVAHVIFPGPQNDTNPEADQNEEVRKEPLAIGLRALAATIVLLPAHLYLNADGVASMVVLLTMATMLRQPGLAESNRYWIAFVAGNAMGGILAAVAYLFTTLQPHLPVLVSVIACGTLFLSYLATRSRRWAAVILPGYVAFSVLFGLVLSPLPLADGVDAVNRVLLIIGAAVYAMAFVSLLIPFLLRFKKTERPSAA